MKHRSVLLPVDEMELAYGLHSKDGRYYRVRSSQFLLCQHLWTRRPTVP